MHFCSPCPGVAKRPKIRGIPVCWGSMVLFFSFSFPLLPTPPRPLPASFQNKYNTRNMFGHNCPSTEYRNNSAYFCCYWIVIKKGFRFCILLYLILSYLILSHIISSHLVLIHFISFFLIVSHLNLSHIISSHLILSYLILSHLISFCHVISYYQATFTLLSFQSFWIPIILFYLKKKEKKKSGKSNSSHPTWPPP